MHGFGRGGGVGGLGSALGAMLTVVGTGGEDGVAVGVAEGGSVCPGSETLVQHLMGNSLSSGVHFGAYLCISLRLPEPACVITPSNSCRSAFLTFLLRHAEPVFQ